MESVADLFSKKMTAENLKKLQALDNAKLHAFVADAITLAEPDSVFVCTDAKEDIEYIRQLSLTNGEEKKLNTKGHTYHFDGYNDQGRDKEVTRYLLQPGDPLAKNANWIERTEGISEIRGLFKGSMRGRQMLVAFFSLGPTGSIFSIPCVQITDSPYVVHSESILYRLGYEQFRKIGSSDKFFRFIHTEGEMKNGVSVNVPQKRIYIDLDEEMVYSANTQYAGNTVGLKKLALRLAIQKASREGWLAEHMFVMAAHGPKGRKTYFTGAFPSACGKTSTSMIPGQTIVGDDIAYFKKVDGTMKCVNVEKGIFGIIQDVNPVDDPVIYDALTKQCEVIFSNVLIKDSNPYWLGMGKELPEEGVNHSGQWHKGNKDADGNGITASHKNARYCLNISELANRDPLADDPKGVDVGGVIYGGRDSDTWVPVEQAFNWSEGIILKGASIESETTAATIGKEGVRTFNLMSNMDFLSIPFGKYIQNNLEFEKGVKKVPLVFSVNYFLKDEKGKYLNTISDKKVWILWAELRVNGDVDAVETPGGYIPKYEDLSKLFKQHLNKDYTQADYVKQFTIKIPNLLAKTERIEKVYSEVITDAPKVVTDTFAAFQKRLKAAQQKHGDNISPLDLAK